MTGPRFEAWEYHPRTGTVVHMCRPFPTRGTALARLDDMPGVVTCAGLIKAKTAATTDAARAVLLDAVRRWWVAYTPERRRPKCSRKHCNRRRAIPCDDMPAEMVSLCLTCRSQVECAVMCGTPITVAAGRPVKRGAAPRWRR